MIERGQGQWNAHVAAGKTQEERIKRLKEVPDQYKAGVIDHVRTVKSLKGEYALQE